MADEVTVDEQPCCSGHHTGINSKKKHYYNVDFKLQALAYADQHSGEKAAKKFSRQPVNSRMEAIEDNSAWLTGSQRS